MASDRGQNRYSDFLALETLLRFENYSSSHCLLSSCRRVFLSSTALQGRNLMYGDIHCIDFTCISYTFPFLLGTPCYLLCYPVTLLPCYLVTLLSCYLVTLLLCHLVALSPCYSVPLLACYPLPLFPCFSVVIF